MGIDLRWQDEQGGELAAVEDPGMLLSAHVRSRGWDGTTCLRFIEAYGDTVFNQRQIPVLVQELEASLEVVNDAAVREHLVLVIDLLRRATGKTHTYAWFIGD